MTVAMEKKEVSKNKTMVMTSRQMKKAQLFWNLRWNVYKKHRKKRKW